MLQAVAPWVADALVLLGVAIMTVGVYGVVWMPDVYNKLHAASKVVFLGIISLLVASAATGDPAFTYRAVLIAVFLLLTTPVSAHVIGRAAYRREQRAGGPDAVDEPGRDHAAGTTTGD